MALAASTTDVYVVPPPLTPPRLDSLPSELLVEIFSYLVPRPSTRPAATSEGLECDDNCLINLSLRNVKAVCKSLAAVVTPLITAHYSDEDFYHVQINAENMAHWAHVKSIISDGPQSYEMRHPRHGEKAFHEYLRLRDVDAELGLSEVWGDSEDHTDEHVDGEPDVDEEESVSPLDSEMFKKMLEDVWGVDDTAQSNYERAAVFCLCPNVEEILYGSDFQQRWRENTRDQDERAIEPIVYAGRGEAFGRVHRFEHLRYLSIDVQKMQIGYVIPVMRLPSLRHLVLEWCRWASFGFDGREANAALADWGCPDRSSNVQTLELRNISCPSSIVRRMIGSCKELKSFSVDVSVLYDQREWYVEVFSGLKEHGSTLEELVVTSSTMFEFEGIPVLGASDLHELERLRHFGSPFRLFTGYGSEHNDASEPALPDFGLLFPPSLQSIEVAINGATPYDETTKAFSNLLQQKGALPRLENVHVTNYTMQRKEYGMPEQTYPVPMDLASLSALWPSKSSMRFNYTLLHKGLHDTNAIEWARTKMLRLPHGEELVKHATCGVERRWNELLSRPVGTRLPFRSLKKVEYNAAQSRGWLREDVSAQKLAEMVKKYEPKSPYTSIKYNF